MKIVKSLLSKCIETRQPVDRALYEWRNLCKVDGFSPAQLFFGRKQLTSLPAAPAHYQFYDVEAAKSAKDSAFLDSSLHHDRDKKFLPPLQPGALVRLQDPKTMRWTGLGTVLSRRPDGLSYEVNSDGRTFFRSRKMIRLEGVPKSSQSTSDPPPALNSRDDLTDCASNCLPGISDTPQRHQPSSPRFLRGARDLMDRDPNPNPAVPREDSESSGKPPGATSSPPPERRITRSFARKYPEQTAKWAEGLAKPLPTSLPRTINATTTGSLTNLQAPHGSSLTGPVSAEGCHPSSSLLCSSSSSTSVGGTTSGPIIRPERQSYMSSPLSWDAVDSAPLTGIPPHLRGLLHTPDCLVDSQDRPQYPFMVSQGPSSTALAQLHSPRSKFMEGSAQAYPPLPTKEDHSQYSLDFPAFRSGHPASVNCPRRQPVPGLPMRQGLRSQTKFKSPRPQNLSSGPPAPTADPLVPACPDQPLSGPSTRSSQLHPALESTLCWTRSRQKKTPPSNFSGSVHSMKLRF